MSVNGIGQNYYQNNIATPKYNRSRAGQFCPQKQAAEASVHTDTRQNANVQDIYKALKGSVSNGYVKGQDSLEDVTEMDAGADDKKLTVWYKGKTMDEWALTSPKYTDSATGISWYVIDGKQPYMTGEDAEKFWKMCEETGEFPLKKFAEMTGSIQQVDRQEAETKTEIIAKPDGSRVLVMTMSIGGMETAMSLEISKPTEVPNENVNNFKSISSYIEKPLIKK